MGRGFNAAKFWGSYFFRSGFWGGDGASTPVPQPITGGPDYGWEAENVAIVWNSALADSITIKDYILAQWPWLANAVLCPINCTGILTGQDGFETVSQANFTATIAPGIIALPATVRQLMPVYGFPTRIAEAASDVGNQGHLSVSVQMSRVGGTGSTFYDNGSRDSRYISTSWDDYPATPRLVNYIDGPSVAAVKNYIDKVRTAHPGGSQLFVYANRRYGEEYWLDDNRQNPTYTAFPKAAGYRTALLAENAGVELNYFLDDVDAVMQDASAVKGLVTWGSHSDEVPLPMSQGQWMSGGANGLRFAGLSNWYLLTTVESYNGRRGTSFNGIAYCFKADVFGGSAYQFTPAGFVASTEEQTVNGVPYQNLFAHWDRGWGLNEVSWANRTTDHFVVYGYPFVSGGSFVSSPGRFAIRSVAGMEMSMVITPGMSMQMGAI